MGIGKLILVNWETHPWELGIPPLGIGKLTPGNRESRLVTGFGNWESEPWELGN